MQDSAPDASLVEDRVSARTLALRLGAWLGVAVALTWPVLT